MRYQSLVNIRFITIGPSVAFLTLKAVAYYPVDICRPQLFQAQEPIEVCGPVRTDFNLRMQYLLVVKCGIYSYHWDLIKFSCPPSPRMRRKIELS